MFGLVIGLSVVVIGLVWRNYKLKKRVKEISEYLEDHLTYPDKEFQETLQEGEWANLQNNIYELCRQWKFEQKRHEREIREMNDFTENLAHQLRNALTSLQLRMDELELSVERMREKELCRKCQQSLERIEEEVKRLLNSSLLAEGKVRMEYVEISMSRLLEKVVSGLEVLCEHKRVDIELDVKEDVFRVDPFWFKQALENLLKNAVEHTKEDSQVNVEVKQKGNYLELSICDQGEGIDEGQYERLFERYYRGSRSKTGYGIGLSMTHDIVKAHHGNLLVTNLPKGGACFTILLPYLDGSKTYEFLRER